MCRKARRGLDHLLDLADNQVAAAEQIRRRVAYRQQKRTSFRAGDEEQPTVYQGFDPTGFPVGSARQSNRSSESEPRTKCLFGCGVGKRMGCKDRPMRRLLRTSSIEIRSTPCPQNFE